MGDRKRYFALGRLKKYPLEADGGTAIIHPHGKAIGVVEVFESYEDALSEGEDDDQIIALRPATPTEGER